MAKNHLLAWSVLVDETCNYMFTKQHVNGNYFLIALWPYIEHQPQYPNCCCIFFRPMCAFAVDLAGLGPAADWIEIVCLSSPSLTISPQVGTWPQANTSRRQRLYPAFRTTASEQWAVEMRFFFFFFLPTFLTVEPSGSFHFLPIWCDISIRWAQMRPVDRAQVISPHFLCLQKGMKAKFFPCEREAEKSHQLEDWWLHHNFGLVSISPAVC